MTKKEIADRIKQVSSFDVEIGQKEDPVLARRQERTVIENEDFKKAFSEFQLKGIEERWREKHGSKISNAEESIYGDIVVLDKENKPVAYIDVKVGTKPKQSNGLYFGGPSITSIYNKYLGERSDRIPRVLLCIADNQEFRVCDPEKMLYWLKRDDAFLMVSDNKKTESWENDIVNKANGKIRVGRSNATASKENKLHAADFFPSFPFKQHLFDC